MPEKQDLAEFLVFHSKLSNDTLTCDVIGEHNVSETDRCVHNSFALVGVFRSCIQMRSSEKGGRGGRPRDRNTFFND